MVLSRFYKIQPCFRCTKSVLPTLKWGKYLKKKKNQNKNKNNCCTVINPMKVKPGLRKPIVWPKNQLKKTKSKPKQLLRSHKCHEFTTKFKKTCSVNTTEHTEWKRDFDVYWRIMKGTENITRKYFCSYLILSVLFIFGEGFYFLFGRNWRYFYRIIE